VTAEAIKKFGEQLKDAKNLSPAITNVGNESLTKSTAEKFTDPKSRQVINQEKLNKIINTSVEKALSKNVSGYEKQIKRNFDDNGENSAKIVVALMSDGMYCIGSESRKYYIGHGEQYVGGASISEIPFVSNAAFVGEVKVIITTDVYNNYSGGDAYYHVRWEETGNDPNGGIVGNIVGQKITHLNVDGTQSILVSGESGYLYSGGTKNWL
ncbi:MAG: hypothetical protein IIC74_10095, partial [Bacteroidetes bacterium]|nr:hypothetical protein [Bacteroidota bacterium]